MAVLEQRIKRSNVQYRSKSEKKKGEKRRDVSLKLKQAGRGGVGEQKPKKRRWKGEQKREQQLRGKEGTTCFAVSLTPAIIHIERNHSCSLKAVFSRTCKNFCVGILLI